jgi:hypothetical protein
MLRERSQGVAENSLPEQERADSRRKTEEGRQHGSIRVRVGQGQSESLASLNKRKTQREAGEDNDDAPSP